MTPASFLFEIDLILHRVTMMHFDTVACQFSCLVSCISNCCGNWNFLFLSLSLSLSLTLPLPLFYSKFLMPKNGEHLSQIGLNVGLPSMALALN